MKHKKELEKKDLSNDHIKQLFDNYKNFQNEMCTFILMNGSNVIDPELTGNIFGNMKED